MSDDLDVAYGIAWAADALTRDLFEMTATPAAVMLSTNIVYTKNNICSGLCKPCCYVM